MTEKGKTSFTFPALDLKIIISHHASVLRISDSQILGTPNSSSVLSSMTLSVGGDLSSSIGLRLHAQLKCA